MNKQMLDIVTYDTIIFGVNLPYNQPDYILDFCLHNVDSFLHVTISQIIHDGLCDIDLPCIGSNDFRKILGDFVNDDLSHIYGSPDTFDKNLCEYAMNSSQELGTMLYLAYLSIIKLIVTHLPDTIEAAKRLGITYRDYYLTYDVDNDYRLRLIRDIDFK